VGLEVLEVEGLIDLQAVEDDRGLVPLAAADEALRRLVGGDRPRKLPDRAQRVVAHPRQARQLAGLDRPPGLGLAGEDPVPGRRDDDPFDEGRGLGEPDEDRRHRAGADEDGGALRRLAVGRSGLEDPLARREDGDEEAAVLRGGRLHSGAGDGEAGSGRRQPRLSRHDAAREPAVRARDRLVPHHDERPAGPVARRETVGRDEVLEDLPWRRSDRLGEDAHAGPHEIAAVDDVKAAGPQSLESFGERAARAPGARRAGGHGDAGRCNDAAAEQDREQRPRPPASTQGTPRSPRGRRFEAYSTGSPLPIKEDRRRGADGPRHGPGSK
jgi:hypothetical protein